MNQFQDVRLDPFFNNQENYKEHKTIPEDAVYACSYFVFVNPIEFGESAFFRRANGLDELWIATFDVEMSDAYKEMDLSNRETYNKFGCAVSADSSGDINKACMTLLSHLFRSKVGFEGPSHFLKEGLIDELKYSSVIRCLRVELDEIASLARERKSSVVNTAEELGLHPEPTGKGPNSWRASCPGTSHPIWINTENDTFGCPWCRRKGGSDELGEFVRERKKKYPNR